MKKYLPSLFIIFLMIFSANLAQAQTEPTLEIPVLGPIDAGSAVTVPVNYTANGNDISSIVFSVDFDETYLIFDSSNTMGFPWPDAITINPFINPFIFSVDITYDPLDTNGELDFNFADISPPLTALPEGDLVTITFTAGNPSVLTEAYVNFSDDPSATFGSTDGQSVSGITIDGSVSIVPEPVSSTLFIVGGATLGFRRFRKKFKK